MAERTLFEKVWGRKREQKDAPLVTLTPQLVEVIRGWGGSPFNYGQLYRNLAPVRTVVDFLADAVATTPLKVYRRAPSGRPEARNHPLARLLRHPNPELTTRTLVWQTVRDVAVYGNAYWRKMESGDTRWVVPLPPFRVTPMGGDILAPTQYRVWMPNGAKSLVLSRDEVAHFKMPDPEDPRIGTSKLAALTNILNEEISMGRYREGFWNNAARMELALLMPGEMSEDAWKRLRADIDNTYGGEKNSGRMGIFEGGPDGKPDIKEVSFSAKDSEYVEGRQFILEATARVFNIPLTVMQLTETPTYASAKEHHKALYQDTLPPWYELVQSEIELQVLSWFENDPENPFYVEFEVEAKLRGSFDEQVQWLDKLVGRPLMEVAEGRQFLNLPDRGDPLDQELALPVQTTVLGLPAPTAPAPNSPPALPSGKALRDFFTRQESSVLGRWNGGTEAFDDERWNRELADLIDTEGAREVNAWVKAQLEASNDHAERRAVFARLQAAADTLG